MRWTKKEREAIEAQILEYENKIENTRYIKRCIFCHQFNKSDDCENCPNIKINKILDIEKRDSGQGECFANDNYFIAKFNLPTFSDIHCFGRFINNIQQLKFRRQMWQDSLDLTKREFLKKYKKEE